MQISKKGIVAIGITVIFIIIAGTFEVLHRTTNTDPVTVGETISAPFSSSINTDFVEDLENRQANEYGKDLGY